jgi:hypothetical protein
LFPSLLAIRANDEFMTPVFELSLKEATSYNVVFS